MSMNRRQLLKGIGAGLSSSLLLPWARVALAEACDEPQTIRRIVFVVEGCGMNYERFTPLGVEPQGDHDLVDTADFQLSPMMSQLENYRDQLMLIDGLSNDQGLAGSGHSTGYAALSSVPNYPPSETGRPGGETIDNYLARTVGRCAVFPHLTLGLGRSTSPRLTSISANETAQPIPYFCVPQDAYNHLFGAVERGNGPNALRRRALFELLRGDIAGLRSKLAGPERVKLDQISAQIELIERRDSILQTRGDTLRACRPPLNALSTLTMEDRLDGHFALIASALLCDLTRVVTLASGAGFDFFDVPFSRLGLSSTKHQMGHGYHGGLDSLDTIHNFHAGHIAQLCDRLSAVPEGDGTMLDNTLIVWTNDNGEQHHASYDRWPVVLIGGRSMGLRTGRYLRFPLRGQPGARTLADLWNTICHLLGAPRDDFGVLGREPVIGPLNTLV